MSISRNSPWLEKIGWPPKKKLPPSLRVFLPTLIKRIDTTYESDIYIYFICKIKRLVCDIHELRICVHGKASLEWRHQKKHMYSMKYVNNNNNNNNDNNNNNNNNIYICLYKGSVDKTTQPARSWPTRRSSVHRPAFKGLPRGHGHFFHDPMTPQITTKAMALPLQVAKGFFELFRFSQGFMTV